MKALAAQRLKVEVMRRMDPKRFDTKSNRARDGRSARESVEDLGRSVPWCLADPFGYPRCKSTIHLGINLGNVGAGMAKHHLRTVEAEIVTHARC